MNINILKYGTNSLKEDWKLEYDKNDAINAHIGMEHFMRYRRAEVRLAKHGSEPSTGVDLPMR